MRLASLQVDGFGKLADRLFTFDSHFNVVVGPNEAGKSTLAAALVAMLYGLGRGEKERWRPWTGGRYAATLGYVLGDGRVFEVLRDFERDARGARVYDGSGADVSAECAVGKVVTPGHAHLDLPLEVFVSASYAGQGELGIEPGRADRITHTLARALDGGPKEDAALGAMKRLDDALSTYVGKKKATVNAPLRSLLEELHEAERRARETREELRELGALRKRLEDESERLGTLQAALREHERRGRCVRAYSLRARLASLYEIRADIASLQAARAEYADVADFPSAVVAEFETQHRAWLAAATLARAHGEEASRARLPAELADELEARERDAGAFDDDAFATLEAASLAAAHARAAAESSHQRAAEARRAGTGGGELVGVAFTAAAFVTLGAIVLAAFRDWAPATVVIALAIGLFALGFVRYRTRRDAARTIADMARTAREASLAEQSASARIAAVLQPLGLRSLEELSKRRARLAELRERRALATRCARRAVETRDRAHAAGAALDALAARLQAGPGPRDRQLAAAKRMASRKSARDGIEAQLSMLHVRLNDGLREDDELALENELAALVAAGVEPLQGPSVRVFEAERGDLERRTSDSRADVAALEAELRAAEGRAGDLAALDERAAVLRIRAERLERFGAAVRLAMNAIDVRTREAHQKFASRLADYASDAFGTVTAERYLDVRVDPVTLEVRARVPETREIVAVERLSAGTREQAYLVVRLAIARMLSEGLESAPLLLDDPFVFWDEERIERGLPILEAAARTAQVILFTTSPDLARAAARRGAGTIEIAPGPPVARDALLSLPGRPTLPA